MFFMANTNIRNIAIIGHGGVGKTSLAEHLLFAGGAIKRAETVESGKTTSDFTPEEIDHKISIHLSALHIRRGDYTINILDTPGSPDFIGEVSSSLRAVESAVMTINGRVGIQIETIKLWRRLNARKMPRLIFVNRCDEEHISAESLVADLSDRFSQRFTAVTLPMGDPYSGTIDLISGRGYKIDDGQEREVELGDAEKAIAEKGRKTLAEVAAETSEELLEHYMEHETLNDEDILRGLTQSYRDGAFVPVFFGSALRDSGLLSLLNFIESSAPGAIGAKDTLSDESEIVIGGDDHLTAFCFKTMIDQYAGQLSYIKVINGVVTPDTEIFNPRSGDKTRCGKIFFVNGGRLDGVNKLEAGDIGALAKVSNTHTNDTLCDSHHPRTLFPLRLPHPIYSVVLNASDRKQEDKLGEALHRILEEDLTLAIAYNAETKETVLSGMGEFHINVVLDKIRSQQKIDITTQTPKVAYRETISKPAEATYRHKKQSGGHGQFGEVSIKIRPLTNGETYHFENMIRGMAVSKGYVPGIEKGLHEAMEAGVIAGYPVAHIGIQLVDGKEHSVDSSEMAFKLAAKGALIEAMSKAGAVLLEPIMSLEAIIEEQYLGDVLSDLNAKRGRIIGQEPIKGGFISIKAQAPQSELLRYAIDLKSITSGTGSFEMEMSHYSKISGRIADEVLKAAKQEE